MGARGTKACARWAAYLLLVLVCVVAELHTVWNNSYQWGATLYDSSIFATMIWRNGWLMNLAPALSSSPYFITHVAPINYIPAFLSYYVPFDFITYFGLVYGIAYGLLLAIMLRTVWTLLPTWGGLALGFVCGLVLFCTQTVTQGAWEPHMEVAAPGFAAFGFYYWQRRRYGWSALWFVLMNAVREDLGIMFGVAIAMLAFFQWVELRKAEPKLARERLWLGVVFTLACFVYSVGITWWQKTHFPVFDLFHAAYYDKDHPFAHITYELMSYRVSLLLYQHQGLWFPMAILLVAAVLMRDAQLVVGAVAFLPYLLMIFFSMNDLSAQWDSYKAFPLMLTMLWPGLVALGRPAQLRRGYLILQCVVLLGGLCYMRPWEWRTLMIRWTLQEYATHGPEYREFGEKELPKLNPDAPTTIVTHAVMSLYPFQFRPYFEKDIAMVKVEDMGKIETYIWFPNDRDQKYTDALLAQGNFLVSNVPGTRLKVAKRVHLAAPAAEAK